MKARFEIGKFYSVQISHESVRKISALCVRITKRTVTFQYMTVGGDGIVTKKTIRRSKAEGIRAEYAYDTDTRYCITSTFADDEKRKPTEWDNVKG